MAKKSRKTTRSKTSRRHPATHGRSRNNTPLPAPDPLDTLIQTTSRALGIKIEPTWIPAIRANLQVTFRLGAVVTASTPPDDTEPGPVFKS